jgi:hypothetical protein
MPYADGETPVLGDYVKNDLEEPGTVTRLRMASNGDDFVSIRRERSVICRVLRQRVRIMLHH